MNTQSRTTAARVTVPAQPVGTRPPRIAGELPRQTVPGASAPEQSLLQPPRTTVPRLRSYDAAQLSRPEPLVRRSSQRSDPIIQSLRAALSAAARGTPVPEPDLDALSVALSTAADAHLRSLNGRAAAHWLFSATLDLTKRLASRDLRGAAAALESAHLALRFAHTRVADAPALWRALADIACALGSLAAKE